MSALLATSPVVAGLRCHCGECGYDLSGMSWYGDGRDSSVTCPGCDEEWGPTDLHFNAEETDSSYAWEAVARLTRELEESRRQVEALRQMLRPTLCPVTLDRLAHLSGRLHESDYVELGLAGLSLTSLRLAVDTLRANARAGEVKGG